MSGRITRSSARILAKESQDGNCGASRMNHPLSKPLLTTETTDRSRRNSRNKTSAVLSSSAKVSASHMDKGLKRKGATDVQGNQCNQAASDIDTSEKPNLGSENAQSSKSNISNNCMNTSSSSVIPERPSKLPRTSTSPLLTPSGKDADSDDEVNAILQEHAHSKRTREKYTNTSKTAKNKGGKSSTPKFCDSLDALLNFDRLEKKEKKIQFERLEKIRQDGAKEDEAFAIFEQTLSASVELLASDGIGESNDQSNSSKEMYGYVFRPLKAPIKKRLFEPSEITSNSPLSSIYKILELNDDDLFAEVLWNKLILLRLLSSARKQKTSMVVCPTDICRYLFATVAYHPSSHMVKGAFSNLCYLLQHNQTISCTAGLPAACFVDDGLRLHLFRTPIQLSTDWKPCFDDFLLVFRNYGFEDSRRSIASVQKMTPQESPSAIQEDSSTSIPFPVTNMQHTLEFLVLCLRSKHHALTSPDAYNLVIFFLRMYFERTLPRIIKLLGSACISLLLQVFETRNEWNREYAPLFCQKIASPADGIFSSPSGWLSIVRLLPKSQRGRQLACGISVYVLQYQDFSSKQHGGAKGSSPIPLTFPLRKDIVVDITSGVTDGLLQNLAQENDPDYGMIYIKLSMVDIALQAFLSVLEQQDMQLLLFKFEKLVDLKRAPMSPTWYNVKTLLQMMRRVYLSGKKLVEPVPLDMTP